MKLVTTDFTQLFSTLAHFPWSLEAANQPDAHSLKMYENTDASA